MAAIFADGVFKLIFVQNLLYFDSTFIDFRQ